MLYKNDIDVFSQASLNVGDFHANSDTCLAHEIEKIRLHDSSVNIEPAESADVNLMVWKIHVYGRKKALLHRNI